MYPYKILGFINLYGLMIGIGIAVCFVVLWTFSKRNHVESRFTDFVTLNAIVSIVVGFLSASLFQSIYDYIEDPSQGFQFNGGLTFIGGLIGGAVCFLIIYFIFRKKYQSRLIDVISILPCSILVAHAFGRVGCFFAGCCYGKPTDSIFGIQFVGMTQKVYPTQLFEAIFLFVLFGICAFLFLKKKFAYNMPVYLIGYGIFRFLIEYIRDDDRGGFVPGMSPSQFWGLVMVVLGIVLIFTMRPIVARRKAYLAEHPIVETPEKSLKESYAEWKAKRAEKKDKQK